MLDRSQALQVILGGRIKQFRKLAQSVLPLLQQCQYGPRLPYLTNAEPRGNSVPNCAIDEPALNELSKSSW